MSLLSRVEVTPYNAQVEFSNANAGDYPQWETGEEAVVAIPQSVAVATRGDQDGKVLIEVWRGASGIDDPFATGPVFDGEFVATSDKVVVGSTVGAELHEIPMQAGRHRLRVFTSPEGQLPTAVYFLID